MNTIRRFTAGLVISLLLVACGGGGSGTDADGAWQGALLTESEETGGATNLRFAMGAGGQAVASWSVFHGGPTVTDQIVNHHDPASGWAGGRWPPIATSTASVFPPCAWRWTVPAMPSASGASAT